MRIFLSIRQNKKLEQTLWKNGFLQYQFIVPKENAKEAILEVLDYLNNVNYLSSLAVLKLHGKKILTLYLFLYQDIVWLWIFHIVIKLT